MIRAVVFDFGQTLVDSAEGFRSAEKETQEKAYGALGLTDREAFLVVYREIRSAYHARSRFSRKAIIEALFLHYGRAIDTALAEQWESQYWQRVQSLTRVFPETPAVLEALRLRGYRLALITNAQGQQQTGMHRIGCYPELEKCFEVVIVAGEGGIAPKPDPMPFCLCLARLGVAAGDSVYVGDDWRIDVCGSEAVGMHPLWLKHRSVRRNWPAVGAAHVPAIDSLEGLYDIEALLVKGKEGER